MRRSEAARYARWAAIAAGAVILLVAGLYAHRAWQASRAKQDAPAAVPPAVQQRTAEFSFSKEEQGRTLFTVRASRTTEYQEGRRSQLEDVWITIYGRTGSRFDNIHTRECDYIPASGEIVCAGEVEMNLESAEEARQRPGERVIHIATVNVRFDAETGEARTENPVEFRFPYGFGHGRGVSYSTREAVLRVHSGVSLTLRPAGSPRPAEPVQLSGGGLEYSRETQTLRILAPVRVTHGPRELAAGLAALELDARLRARVLTLSGEPVLRWSEDAARGELRAGEFVTRFTGPGEAERVTARGNVRGRWQAPSGEERLTADEAVIILAPGGTHPQQAEARGRVKLESVRGAAVTRKLETSALRLHFTATPGGARRLQRAETLAATTAEWRDGAETSLLRGERLAAEFDAHSRFRRLTARDGAALERRAPGRPAQQSTSHELAMTFDAAGAWTEFELHGDARLRESDHTARADRARLVRATDTAVLEGRVTVADALTRTSAPRLTLNQHTGEITGEGGVRTTYLTAAASPANFDRQPAHLSADRLRADTNTGRALYSGRARMWQGEAVIEAQEVELFRAEERLEARGTVNALVPQASRGGERVLWRARGERLTYRAAEGRAVLEGGVTAQSALGHIQARSLVLEFVAGATGVQELARAVARGGVVLHQGERRGAAEQAEYVAAEGKFVLSGGTPALFDPMHGSTTGRQLTFFLADDRILVESQEGVRTLTKHRVEK